MENGNGCCCSVCACQVFYALCTGVAKCYVIFIIITRPGHVEEGRGDAFTSALCLAPLTELSLARPIPMSARWPVLLLQ